jgi:hypothetical protein
VTTSTTSVTIVTPRALASSRALATATSEKSTAVAAHPCSASQTALRASPAATSIARSGTRSATSRTTNW